MGLAWQQGPLATRAVGHFLVEQPLPERLLFAEPLRRRMRVRFGGEWVADSEDVVLLHEPGRYPVAYFPVADVREDVLVAGNRTTTHRELGPAEWFTVRVAGHEAPRAAWRHTGLPGHADVLRDRVAFAWRAMDAFYEEDERIVGHAADPYHRIDLAALTPVEGETFCPYKGLAGYFDIGPGKRAAWSYPEAWPEVERVSGFVSFEPDLVDVTLDGRKLALEPGQTVTPHGIDRGLDPGELRSPVPGGN
ncbi:DUF427 domain-containing protein [Amycolatopsis sp. NPDC004169]|uniref:DUF427 domain-containing protein n=1 Tax=Amycolatopsis sp. NPDC004169 TaxID=3154453 RepID=UPI0033AFD757